VRYAEYDGLVQALDVFPNDPGFQYQYGLINIRAPQGWAISTGSSIVTIAVIDSGVDATHPDLVAKLLPGYDFVESDNIPQDEYGHGTHVSGIAAASSNNGMGVSGVSWGAQILPVRVLDAGGNGSYATLAAGIIWAVDHGAQILNLSLGGTAPNSTLLNAVNYATDRGALIIAASGNDGSGNLRYPARYPVVVSVGSTNSINQRSGYSNYGTGLDLMAPGESIYSTNPGGGYGFRTGTSMSTPFVSGLAAILWGMSGYGSALSVETAMEKTALDLGNPGWDGEYGYGLIQMDAALLYGTNPPHPHKTPTSPSLYGYYVGPTETPSISPSPTITLTLPMTPSVPQVLTGTAEIVGLSTAINVGTNTPSHAAIVPAPERNGQTGQDRNDLLLLAGSCFVLGGIAFIVLLVLVRKRQK
jgi:subtilisin family serine protease